MFGLSMCYGSFFFNKRRIPRRKNERRHHLIGNFAVFYNDNRDRYFGFAQDWHMTKNEFNVI